MKISNLITEMFGLSRFYEYNELIDKARNTKKFSPKTAVAVPDVFVGIEVEVEGVFHTQNLMNFTPDHPLWRVTEDGSLRNNGKEYVSTPLRGDNIPFALDVLHSHLTTSKNCLGHEFTDRTSVHVHIDSRHLSLENVGVFLLSYILVEPILYRYCGGYRHQNIFCVPLNMTNMARNISNFFKGLEKENSEYIEMALYDWPKYTGLNLLPLTHYGTIEFRHMVGNCNVEKLTVWINLLLSLHKYAKSQSYTVFKERVLNLNTSSEYRLFLYEVFGKNLDVVLCDDLETHMEDMVIFIKDVFSYGETSFELDEKSLEKSKFISHASIRNFIIKKEERKKVIKNKRQFLPIYDQLSEQDIEYSRHLPEDWNDVDITLFWERVLHSRTVSPDMEDTRILEAHRNNIELMVNLRNPEGFMNWGVQARNPRREEHLEPVRIARAPQFRRNRGE